MDIRQRYKAQPFLPREVIFAYCDWFIIVIPTTIRDWILACHKITRSLVKTHYLTLYLTVVILSTHSIIKVRVYRLLAVSHFYKRDETISLINFIPILKRKHFYPFNLIHLRAHRLSSAPYRLQALFLNTKWHTEDLFTNTQTDNARKLNDRLYVRSLKHSWVLH